MGSPCMSWPVKYSVCGTPSCPCWTRFPGQQPVGPAGSWLCQEAVQAAGCFLPKSDPCPFHHQGKIGTSASSHGPGLGEADVSGQPRSLAGFFQLWDQAALAWGEECLPGPSGERSVAASLKCLPRQLKVQLQSGPEAGSPGRSSSSVLSQMGRGR